MACTLSTEAESKLRADGVLPQPTAIPGNVVLVGCGGLTIQPKCTYDLEVEVYGFKFIVPTLLVPGQKDEFIIGSNVIKCVLQKMKAEKKYWELISCQNSNPECEQFLELLSCVSRWSGSCQPDKLGTLLPKTEHLVWGKLPANTRISPGSTVIVEPTTSRSAPRHVLVGRVVTPMWGDQWVPMKILNSTQSMITLRRNTKLADVSPCLAVEDVPLTQGVCKSNVVTDSALPKPILSVDPVRLLHKYGLEDIDINGCEVSESWKEKLASLIVSYQDVFSRDRLDCGEAKDFVHRIHLCDERPFRLPYHRIPPAHYQKLREVLSDMEEKGIISKSVSEYASPLVMVWKKDGSLRICTDFRWLNAKTVKDAHPLPHQQDCLAALGGNLLFSSMDLTSGFYNIPLHVSDRHYTAFTTPMGLYEYNRLPQGLCISPGSFMCMMLSIFGDLNFSSLLCYLDDLLVFARSEQEALSRLEMVFSSLIPECSRIAKPLFNLTAGQRRLKKGTGSHNRAGTFRELSPLDWTPACDVAFEELQRALVHSVVLAHPEFERPFILCTDVSLDGLGAVLSQVPAGEYKARPIAFASKSLSRSQVNYPAHRLEFLALKWSICDKFSHWLKDHEFTETFRLTCQPQTICTQLNQSFQVDVSMTAEDVSSILSSCDDWDSGAVSRATSIADHLSLLFPDCHDVPHAFSLSEMQSQQHNDAVILKVTFYVSRKRRPSRRERVNEDSRVLRLQKQWDKLILLNGVLYRVVKDPLTKHKKFQFILPDSLKQQALSGVHDLAGQQSQPRTLSLARQRFYWPEMEPDVCDYVKTCTRCVLSKTPEPAARAPLESIKTTAPLELVCIDFWAAEDRHNKSVDVLVITDHFTKLAHAFPCRNQSAKSVAKKLWDGFFCIYGFPQRLHSDQGASFESELNYLNLPV
ncbi:hypothetical protein QQF64_034331 [Cirrhinus molitorella]|uniref:Gypsy retrotransposon integrase-like protein 1 n=1 Tax=Cirrhinus molitorella TaxID=172907 RepID=A0ABR3L3Q1_9TELE